MVVGKEEGRFITFPGILLLLLDVRLVPALPPPPPLPLLIS
jgi:hypothetical protein